ncbi:MAG: MMPL family transporter [Ruminococcus sp.]|nr:MMPL family transporter [Ruminococcus sp.]
MKKIADLIVEKRILIFLTVLVIAGVCAVLIFKVEVNTDLTKYLPDDSSMKIGMDLMDEEFPEAEGDYTVRVVFKNLTEEQIAQTKKELSEIKNVDKVDYKSGDEEYNRDGYTKFVVHTKYDYDTAEELAVEEAIETGFSRNGMMYKNDSNDTPDFPLWVAFAAVAMITTILIIMSGSWIEPFLFLFTIGIAVAINMGTNIFIGEISEKTFSVAAILQLVLSMDYSIILISRYRQELAKTADRKDAMKAAIIGAFSSISSSSLTTVVGLLAMLFMSFKLGLDMGVVLAKGVLLSVICVFLVMPGLILICSKAIEKTAKPSPVIPTGGLARLCNKLRLPITVAFVGLFVAAYILQKQTVISYSMTTADPIADIFPKTSTVVMLYENKDDEKVTAIAEELEKQDNVKAATNYSNMLGKQHTAADMVDAVNDLSESMGSGKEQDIEPDESMFNMLYYKYYGGEAGTMTAGEFMRFIAEDVMTNETFKSYISNDMEQNTAMIKRLSDAQALQTPVSAAELAEFFGMEESQCTQLFTYYCLQRPDAEAKPLTANEFVSFILDDLASDETYASMFDKQSLAQMQMLRTFTDKSAIQQPLSPKELAQYLGMDETAAQQLAGYYHQMNQTGSTDMKLSVYEMVSFLCGNKEQFAQSMDAAMLGQMEQLKGIMDTALGEVQLDEISLAAMLGMEQGQAHQLTMLYTMRSPDFEMKLSAAEFVNFLVNGVLADESMAQNFTEENRTQLTYLSKLINAVVSEQKYTSSEMTELFRGMTDELDENETAVMYLYHDANGSPDKTKTMSVEQLMNYLNDTLICDETFKPLLDDDTVSDIKQNAADLNDGIKQLKGPNYSRLILSVTVPEEGEETDAFYELVNEKCKALTGEYHLIGSSAMNYEMSQTFDSELLFITILTAAAIFLVVLITFRSVGVPLILVLLVQTGVYITVTVIGFQGYSIYFLALMIVQCILMGSTIDYGILFSNYYREFRRDNDRPEALKKAYSGSMHTILTSGLIMVTTTAILGQCYGEPTVEQICRTISIGAASAIILIIFILPGVLAFLDRFTAGRNRKK